MDIRFDSVPARQALTPIKATAKAAQGAPADAPAGQVRDANHGPARAPAVTPIDDHVQTLRRELRFRVDETTGLTVVRVVEAETGTLIRQIPSQLVLEMHAAREATRSQRLRERA
jgi:flagellar protein FlaG